MKRVLKIVEPTIVPRPMSPSVKNIDIIEMKRVGAELPIAINVAPATSGLRPRHRLIWFKEATKKSSHTTVRAQKI
jgi:hypothetical protein